jgi:hypothetical protein
VEAILSGAWVVLFLGWPFAAFNYEWPNAWWGTQAITFVVNFWVFTSLSKSIFGGTISGVLLLPWYLPLILYFYPVMVLEHLAPHAWWGFKVIALLAGFPLTWWWFDYAARYEPWLWECDRCGYRVSTIKGGTPAVKKLPPCEPSPAWLEERATSRYAKRPIPKGAQGHSWELIRTHEDDLADLRRDQGSDSDDDDY